MVIKERHDVTSDTIEVQVIKPLEIPTIVKEIVREVVVKLPIYLIKENLTPK